MLPLFDCVHPSTNHRFNFWMNSTRLIRFKRIQSPVFFLFLPFDCQFSFWMIIETWIYYKFAKHDKLKRVKMIQPSIQWVKRHRQLTKQLNNPIHNGHYSNWWKCSSWRGVPGPINLMNNSSFTIPGFLNWRQPIDSSRQNCSSWWWK